MMLNEGMFAGTGGWALKPEGYRCSGDGTQETVQPRRHQLSLEIQLCGAQRLPLPAEKDSSHAPRMKPYVKAQLHADSCHLPGYSKDIKGNGNGADEPQAHGYEEKDSSIYKRRSTTSRSDCPNFNGERMTWLKMSDVIEELSFIRYVYLFFYIFQIAMAFLEPAPHDSMIRDSLAQ